MGQETGSHALRNAQQARREEEIFLVLNHPKNNEDFLKRCGMEELLHASGDRIHPNRSYSWLNDVKDLMSLRCTFSQRLASEAGVRCRLTQSETNAKL